jgi:hypothetical protein
MATAVLIVRARLTNLADRERFDRWYRAEHLPRRSKAIQAQRGWAAGQDHPSFIALS